MRRQLALLGILLSVLSAYASDYRQATIIQIRPVPTSADGNSAGSNGTATLNSHDAYAITILLDGTYYTSIYERKWKWSNAASQLNPGDTVFVRIEGDKLLVKQIQGKDLKTTIVSTRRREH